MFFSDTVSKHAPFRTHDDSVIIIDSDGAARACRVASRRTGGCRLHTASADCQARSRTFATRYYKNAEDSPKECKWYTKSWGPAGSHCGRIIGIYKMIFLGWSALIIQARWKCGAQELHFIARSYSHSKINANWHPSRYQRIGRSFI